MVNICLNSETANNHVYRTESVHRGAFRNDIQGMRGVAITAVLLFHLGIPGAEGGFLGVDMFFVISGFLVTGIVQTEVDRGSFSLLGFFSNRVRRLAPALIVMLSLSSCVALMLLLPNDLSTYGRSMAATVIYISNLEFAFRTAGYFSSQSESNPLLHTWSLSVEEQFYILLPIIIMVWPRSIRREILYISIISASYLAALYFGWHEKAYFLPPFRFWEFASGALVRYIPSSPPIMQMITGVSGLIILLSDIYLFDGSAPFPFPCATLCVIGTSMILFGSPSQLVGKILSVGLLRGLGSISYSVYLWHWPVIVFMRYYSITPLNMRLKYAALIMSLVFGYLSWKHIEKKYRSTSKNGWYGDCKKIMLISILLLIVSVCLYIGPLKAPYSGHVNVIAMEGRQHGKFSICLDQVQGNCHLGAENVSPSFIVWGDSHAASLADGLDMIAHEDGLAGILSVVNSCPPLIGVRGWWAPTAERCVDNNEYTISMSRNPEIKIVILQAFWKRSLKNLREGGPLWLGDVLDRLTSEKATLSAFKYRILKTINAIKRPGLKVFVVGDVPSASADVPFGIEAESKFGRKVRLGLMSKEAKSSPTDAVLESVAHETGVNYLSPADIFCKTEECEVKNDEGIFYFDDSHLNKRGSELLKAMDRHILEHN